MTHFGNLVCGDPDCGTEYAPTPDGRLWHRQFYGHTPARPRTETPGPVLISPRCKDGKHWSRSDGCGGGFLHNGHATGCTCWCHDAARDQDEVA